MMFGKALNVPERVGGETRLSDQIVCYSADRSSPLRWIKDSPASVFFMCPSDRVSHERC